MGEPQDLGAVGPVRLDRSRNIVIDVPGQHAVLTVTDHQRLIVGLRDAATMQTILCDLDRAAARQPRPCDDDHRLLRKVGDPAGFDTCPDCEPAPA